VERAHDEAKGAERSILLGQAVERDPRYGHALARAALCHHQLLDAGEGETHLRPAVDFARRATKRVGSLGDAEFHDKPPLPRGVLRP
jgi:hypothetical protein